MDKNNITHIPRHVQDLLCELEFLSQQSPGKKTCIHAKIFVDASSWYGSIYRTLYKEKKTELINHLKQVMDIYSSSIEEHPEYRPILEPALRRARNGVMTLFETYKGCESFKSQLKVVMILIDLNLGMTPEEVNNCWEKQFSETMTNWE